jgi:hypothetical protein
MDGHYDPYGRHRVGLEGSEKDRVRVEETGAGLVERDRTTGRVIWSSGKPAGGCLPSSSTRCRAATRRK